MPEQSLQNPPSSGEDRLRRIRRLEQAVSEVWAIVSGEVVAKRRIGGFPQDFTVLAGLE